MQLSNQPFFLEGGGSHACLMLHGLGGGVYELQWLGEYLHGQGWTVWADNYPGHAADLLTMPPSTWQQWYAQAEAQLLKLQTQYETVSVVGFSTGCPLALHLACHYPIDKLVLLSPYMSLRYEWYYLLPPEVYLRTLGQFITYVPRQGPHVKDKAIYTLGRQASSLRQFHIPTAQSALTLIDLAKSELPMIQTTLCIIQSKQDSVVAPSGAQFIYDHIASPIKNLHWLQDSDHVITMDYQREEVFRITHNFLEAIP